MDLNSIGNTYQNGKDILKVLSEMKSWQAGLLAAGVIAFTGANTYLIIKEDSKIDKSVYISEWQRAAQGDLKETLSKPGVAIPQSEYPVYFSEEDGTFSKFLVKPGDKVTPGTPLYEYESVNLDRDRNRIESEIEQLTNQIDSVQNHISSLNNYLSALEAEQAYTSTDAEKEEKDLSVSIHDTEKEILLQELEADLLEDERDKYEEQLDYVNEQTGVMSYLSEIEGQIVSISEDLDNPVLMIRSEAAAVKGKLDEKELQKVVQGQETAVESGTLKKDFTGRVASVQTMPETPLSTETQASYPFTVELDQAQEKLENLHPGMQLNVEITTGEAKDAVVAPSKSIMKQNDKEYVIVLNSVGKTEKREVQEGLKVKGSSEVVSGLEQQEPLMLHPKPAAEISREFFTPFTMDKFYPGALKHMTNREKLKYFLLGMFNR
ncbi:hypothetical protein B14911_04459 [Bacillus sp. NRRL B-14911]|nr:hypothetical protein B14911_04459 [Bacillus sp. NRRL B-14911]